VEEQKGDERRVGGRERKRARGREVLISLDPFVDSGHVGTILGIYF